MATHITHTTDDGHTAEALHFFEPVQGVVTVMASCCGLEGQDVDCACGGNASCRDCRGSGKVPGPDTRQTATFYGDALKDEAAIEASIRGHVQKVATDHAAADRARTHLIKLVKHGARSMGSEGL